MILKPEHVLPLSLKDALDGEKKPAPKKKPAAKSAKASAKS